MSYSSWINVRININLGGFIMARQRKLSPERKDFLQKLLSAYQPEGAQDVQNMKLNKAADKLLNGVAETLTYMDFPEEHWKKIRTNNAIERLNREIRRRTRVIGTFPDGESALMLVCARLRHELLQCQLA